MPAWSARHEKSGFRSERCRVPGIEVSCRVAPPAPSHPLATRPKTLAPSGPGVFVLGLLAAATRAGRVELPPAPKLQICETARGV